MPLPPLVAPGPPLTADDHARHARQLLVPGLGVDGQRRLRAARVLVVGAGGLGSPVLLYLAAAGVGTLGVVDDDVVEQSNLQRQVLHTTADLGRPKVRSAAESVRAIDPRVTVVEHHERLTAGDAEALVAGYDVVVDGTDNFATRYVVADACTLADRPLVWGAVLRWDGQVSISWSDPPAGAGYPGVHYRDVFPAPPPPGAAPSCAEAGVLGAVCASVGGAMATEVVKLVCGTGEPLLGRVLVLDALGARWREVVVRPTPGRRPVTVLEQPPDACRPDAAAGTPAALAPVDLAARLAARDRGEDDLDLVDLRTAAEREVVRIPGSRAVPLQAFLDGTAYADLDPARPLVLHCQSGRRSAEALAAARARGFDAVHLDGGVLRWLTDVGSATG
ncbi:ThiF family adenylyltransferase [Cellulomonas triticagri]|uniref:Adenylyltransferase/sulfurtransferase MoeZ n=1 Tax=Cellulomonas triticagri TaxID=2483352 RepID=A0A3M2JDX0_9CELL|nr:ThiF family adenylyltransferase [Cellulomonas triticagri]RMI09135.1 adenylyltransferase/sulfurtransferase MoeZ [Cellulomonas triticagri]